MKSLLRNVLFTIALCLVCPVSNAADTLLMSPDNPGISCAGFVRMETLANSASPTAKTVRFERILEMPNKGYRWDNPGVVIRFRTSAEKVGVILYFSDRHISATARNSIGRYWIDGRTDPNWTFRTAQTVTQRKPETVTVEIGAPSAGTAHNYEVVLPYGDSVEFCGLRLPENAQLDRSPEPYKARYVAYGDSITHGFSASETSKSYAFLLAEQKGWQLVNMGFGGRSSTPDDGVVVGSLNPDIVTVLMGVNDWLGNISVANYRLRMKGFLEGLRAQNPHVPVYVITPLWVPLSWPSKQPAVDLEEYRSALRELVASMPEFQIHLVEGPELIDHDTALLDACPVHPNDQGFVQMAQRLGNAISPLRDKPCAFPR